MGLNLSLKTISLTLSFAILIAGLPRHALAQSATTEAETTKPVTPNTSPPATEEEAAPNNRLDISNEELAELDEQLLGPWVFLTDSVSKDPSSVTLTNAVARCIAPAQIKKLDIEPGAERKLPIAADLHGDLIYYRTKKGLQRFEVQLGQLTLLTEAKKFDKSSGKVIWAIIGRTAGHAIRFANTAKRGGKAQLMLEDNKLYLRCRLNASKTPASDN